MRKVNTISNASNGRINITLIKSLIYYIKILQVCREWEAKASSVVPDVRLVLIRIGVVLGEDGGALGQLIIYLSALNDCVLLNFEGSIYCSPLLDVLIIQSQLYFLGVWHALLCRSLFLKKSNWQTVSFFNVCLMFFALSIYMKIHISSDYLLCYLDILPLIVASLLIITAKMIPLFMMFAGGPLGSGNQWWVDMLKRGFLPLIWLCHYVWIRLFLEFNLSIYALMATISMSFQVLLDTCWWHSESDLWIYIKSII